MQLKALLFQREAVCIKKGGPFTFSIPYSENTINEIKEMGEEFTRRYQYTVAPVHGTDSKIICIGLKDLNRR